MSKELNDLKKVLSTGDDESKIIIRSNGMTVVFYMHIA
jgi:hypothetical protein